MVYFLIRFVIIEKYVYSVYFVYIWIKFFFDNSVYGIKIDWYDINMHSETSYKQEISTR